MNKLKKLKLIGAAALSLIAFDASADIIELEDNAVRTTSAVGKITVTHEDGSFYVTKQEKKFPVGRENLDIVLRDITGEQLKGFTKANNYLQVTELSNGEFKLDGKVRAPGGGIILAQTLSFWGTVVGGPAGGTVGWVVGMLNPLP